MRRGTYVRGRIRRFLGGGGIARKASPLSPLFLTNPIFRNGFIKPNYFEVFTKTPHAPFEGNKKENIMYFVGIIYGVDGKTTLFPCANEEWAKRHFERLQNSDNAEFIRGSDTLVYRRYNDGNTTRTDTIFIGKCDEEVEKIVAIQHNTDDIERIRRRRAVIYGGRR